MEKEKSIFMKELQQDIMKVVQDKQVKEKVCDGTSSSKSKNTSQQKKNNNEFMEKGNKIAEVVHYYTGDNEGMKEKRDEDIIVHNPPEDKDNDIELISTGEHDVVPF